MLSYEGMTNSQLILSSDFQYSEKPDEIKIISDDLGMPRKYYELTWHTPASDKITVTQTLEVEINRMNVLYTKAEYPYSTDMKKKFVFSLGADKDEGIDPCRQEV